MSTLTMTHPSVPARAVASATHTVTLLAIMAAIAVSGAAFQHGGVATPAHASPSSVLATYGTLLLSEWAMFFYVWKRGLRQTDTPLRELVGGRWLGVRDVVRDLALGAAVWGAWVAVEWLWPHVFGADRARSIQSFLPRTIVEGVAWVALSLSAGFVEEVVYRGYFQRQFSAWTGRPWLALLMQATVFGVSHGYQGVDACMRITLYALLLGALAQWRRSLRPGMITHALTDVVAGLFRI